MTDKHYNTILELLADKVKEQEDTIGFQKYRIDLLEQKLKAAEEHTKQNDDKSA